MLQKYRKFWISKLFLFLKTANVRSFDYTYLVVVYILLTNKLEKKATQFLYLLLHCLLLAGTMANEDNDK